LALQHANPMNKNEGVMKKKLEKTNGSQALGRALFLAQPASDDCAGNGSVTNGNADELSSLPEEFGGMYRACYEAGHASGFEAGFRQGYRAGFEDGRRQGEKGSPPAAAAVENSAANSEVGNSELRSSEVRSSEVTNAEAGDGASGVRKPRLFGLPCTKCGAWFFSDEARCPRCQTPRAKAPETP
jgi:hypothetical protein